MTKAIYFSYGMTKCGSTLAHELACETLRAAGFAQPRLPATAVDARARNFVRSPTAEQIDIALRFGEAMRGPIALKLHSPPSAPIARMLEDGRAVGHAVFRDPREMALSMLDHGRRSRATGERPFAEFETIEQTLPRIEAQIGAFRAWAALPGVVPWHYDDFAWDKPGAIRRLAAQLGLRVDAETVAARRDWTVKTVYNKAAPSRWREDMAGEVSAMFLDRFAGFYAEMDAFRAPWRASAGPARPRGRPLLSRLLSAGRA